MDSLLNLIRSLSAKEKSQYVKYARQHLNGKDSNKVALFQLISQELRGQIKDYKKQAAKQFPASTLPSLKTQLYNQILESLTHGSVKTVRGELSQMIDEIQTLMDRGLLKQGLARIEKALPPQEVRDLRAILDRLHVGRLSPRQDIGDAGTVDPALLPAFERAFVRRMVLRFRYCDAKNNPSDRQVEPQAMLLLPSLWYLVAWDPGRAGFRHFRMDRISRPEIVEGPAFRHRHVPFEEDVCPFRDLPR